MNERNIAYRYFAGFVALMGSALALIYLRLDSVLQTGFLAVFYWGVTIVMVILAIALLILGITMYFRKRPK